MLPWKGTSPGLSNKKSTLTKSRLLSTSNFQTECNRVFSKMLDVVPSTVELSDAVTPMPFKAVNIQYDLSSDGTVTVAGLIRVRLLPLTLLAPIWNSVSNRFGPESDSNNGDL